MEFLTVRHVKATFYLPVRDNDGRDLASEIGEVERLCFGAFGAWSLHGYIKGKFQMATGEEKLDTSAVYSIVIEEDRVDELKAILVNFKTNTRQEKIYLEIQRDVDFWLL